jgi:hypothetical protein
MPVFRKFNPKKFNPGTGQPRGKGNAKAPFHNPSRVPFSKFLLSAFVLHQCVTAAAGWWRRWQQGRRRRALQLAARNAGMADGVEEEEEQQWEEMDPEVAAADARLRMVCVQGLIANDVNAVQLRRVLAYMMYSVNELLLWGLVHCPRHQELLPAMMRAAMPKPKRRNTAQAAAAAHKGRPRHLPTAHAPKQAVSDAHNHLLNFASRCQ